MSPILKTYATNHHSPSCLFYPTIPFLGFSAPGQSRGDCLLTHGRAFLRRKSSRPRGSRRSTDLDGVPYVGSDVSVSSFGTRTPGALPVAAVRPRGPGWCSAAVVCARFSGCVFFFLAWQTLDFPRRVFPLKNVPFRTASRGRTSIDPRVAGILEGCGGWMKRLPNGWAAWEVVVGARMTLHQMALTLCLPAVQLPARAISQPRLSCGVLCCCLLLFLFALFFIIFSILLSYCILL